MAKHPKHVEGWSGSLTELAKAVGNMTYDQTAAFIAELSADLRRQAEADLGRGRKKLAGELNATAEMLDAAEARMGQAWKICEPFMENE